MRRLILTTSRDAAIVVLLSVVVALGVNAFRPDALPLVAREAYRILVPCPEPVGEVEALEPAGLRWEDERELVIDARDAAGRAAWQAPGARSVPFDFLDPVADDVLADLVATGAARVVVFGDGLAPDSGQELARELAGRGMRNVHYVPGGWQAVKASLEPREVAP
ncbi:MAG: hypothetical protein ABIO70_10220 [Pseudomonadota bacterium]